MAGGFSGTVYIQVTDTDRTQGNRSLESINVDHLYIRVEGGSPGTPPIAPANLHATAMSASRVDLTWTDLSDDEAGFAIERSPEGSSWQPIATAAADAITYTDSTVIGDTLYYYRINANNAAGSSAWDGPVTVQTPVGIGLTASGYKVKGIHHTDLGWTGTSGQGLDIYRDGNVIHTVEADGPTTYTDNIGQKGNGSYTYQICDSGGSSCSNAVTIIF